jgi:hypothetical protein
MNKSRLLDTIKSFSLQEFKRFAEYLASDYFVKHQDTKRLGLYILDFAPDFPEDNLEKGIIKELVFENSKLDDKKLFYVMNLLQEHVERFLAQQAYEQENELMESLLLKELSRRGLYQLMKSRNDKFVKSALTQPMKVEAPLYKYWKERAVLDGKATQTSFRDLKGLEEVSRALDEFFILSKLEISLEMYNFSSMGQKEFSPWLLDEVLAHIERQPKNPTLVDLFYKMVSLFKNTDDEVFQKFLSQLHKEENKVAINHLKSLYSLAINYCIAQSRTISRDYLDYALELYRLGIANDYLLDDGYLQHRNFNNIVRIALINGQIPWVKDFIENFKQKIRKEWRDEAVNIALAEVYFHEENYDETITHLNKLHFKEVGYFLNSRVILLKTFYEMDSIDPMLYFLASFMMYLRRNKQISKITRESNLNFAMLLNSIVNKLPSQTKGLMQKIEKTNPVSERAWLQQKWKEKMEKQE